MPIPEYKRRGNDKYNAKCDVNFSVVLYIAKAGVPEEDEMHLANEEGFVLGELDSFTLRIEGSGSLFPEIGRAHV